MSYTTPSQLLDQLMGPNRNSLKERKKLKRHWSDEDVCKHFLAGFCPNELFIGTKADIGECKLRHADVLKEQYEANEKYGTMGYEEDLIDYIEDLLEDCNGKIQQARDRLESNKQKNKELRDKAEIERQGYLDSKIEKLLIKIETLGHHGNVTEAQEVADVIDKLRKEKQAAPDASNFKSSELGAEREMDVCQVCSALILVGDTQIRIEDHIQGKQHAGYAKLREQHALMQDRYWIKNEEQLKIIKNNLNNRKSMDPVEKSTIHTKSRSPERSRKRKDEKSRSRRSRRHSSSSSVRKEERRRKRHSGKRYEKSNSRRTNSRSSSNGRVN